MASKVFIQILKHSRHNTKLQFKTFETNLKYNSLIFEFVNISSLNANLTISNKFIFQIVQKFCISIFVTLINLLHSVKEWELHRKQAAIRSLVKDLKNDKKFADPELINNFKKQGQLVQINI